MRAAWLAIVIVGNLIAVVCLISLRQYAHGYQKMQADMAYKVMIERGMLDQTKDEDYAKSHHGWNAKSLMQNMGNPKGFVDAIFWVSIATCFCNLTAVAFLTWKFKAR